jgi:predicted enzyme related to lactoylglutathione lyase
VAGRPIWYELMTPDPAAVAPFYKATLGWDIQDLDTATPTGHPYWMIGRADGGHAGGVLLLTDEMRAGGAGPGWLPYFDVDDVEASVAKAQSLGAKVWLPPMTMDVGTMAMLGDPQGAAFYVMDPVPPPDQPETQSDVFKPMAPGHCSWNELNTTDAAGAVDFYTALFGWTKGMTMPMGALGDYQFIEVGGEAIGAVSPVAAPPALWLPVFGVAEIVAAKSAAEAHGGTVTQDIQEIPGGQFALCCTDPSGAALGFVGPKGG